MNTHACTRTCHTWTRTHAHICRCVLRRCRHIDTYPTHILSFAHLSMWCMCHIHAHISMIRIYVRMHIHMYIYIYTYTYICIYIYIFTHTYACVCMYVSLSLSHSLSLSTCKIYACITFHAHTCRYIVHALSCMWMHVRTHAYHYYCKHTYIYMYIHYAYVYIYIYICIYTCKWSTCTRSIHGACTHAPVCRQTDRQTYIATDRQREGRTGGQTGRAI